MEDQTLTPRTEHEMFNTAEAAAYIGMSQIWLAKTRMHDPEKRIPGGPPFYKRPGSATNRVFYKRADLDAWLEAHRCEL